MSKSLLKCQSFGWTSLLGRQISNSFTNINRNLLERWYRLPMQRRAYAKVCKDCCKVVKQTEGRRVEDPKTESTLPYRPGCPAAGSTMPHGYDPYRIKVPEIVVPPLPPSSAKGDEKQSDVWQLFKSPEIGLKVKDLFRNSSLMHQEYWKENTGIWKADERPQATAASIGPPPRLSYHGHNKYKFAFHEPWRPLDRLALLADAEKQHEEREQEKMSKKLSGSDFVAPTRADCPPTETMY